MIDNRKIAFVCLAFGEKYVSQQKILEESITSIYPDADLFFYTESFPEGSKSFSDSLYGFKPHAINAAINAGFTKIVFFDPAMILKEKLDFYDTLIKDYGVLAVQDDSKLSGVTSDRCKEYFNIDDAWLQNKHLVGGSFYYFDFQLPLCRNIFNDWKAAEEAGIYGSQDEQSSGRLQGHRSDETVMAICLYKHGVKPLPYADSRYNWAQNPIMIKKHFK